MVIFFRQEANCNQKDPQIISICVQYQLMEVEGSKDVVVSV
jgi:hypothetical protein